MSSDTKLEKDVVFSKDIHVRSYEVDATGHFSMQAICNHLQDIAWEHACKLGFGYEQLAQQNLFWVLSRLKIQIKKYPLWNDKVILKTWPRGSEKLFAYRDYTIEDKNGQLLFAATSAWLILDKTNHRPQPSDFLGKVFSVPESRVRGKNLEKLPSVENDKKNIFFKVLFSHLDMNQHVNYSKYIQWILDSYPHKIHLVDQLKSLEINFLAEAELNDGIAVQTQKIPGTENQFLHSLIRKHDKKEITRARLIWDKSIHF